MALTVTNMHEKIFSKPLIISVLIVLSVAGIIKAYSIQNLPEVHDWNHYQIKRINKAQTNFSFIVFGDNKNSITTFNELIDRVNKENVSFAIDVGDLVFNGEKEYFSLFINQIRRLNKPLLTAIGNHELYDRGRANYYDIFGRFYYSFSVGNSYFIVLDDANEENIDIWQMNWLKNELQKSMNYKYRFIFMHVPLYDPREGKQPGHSLKNVTLADELNDLFDKYNVTMLFCSHIHAYYRGIWNRTPYIITGGAGAELEGTDPNHYFHHYIKVDVSDNGVRYHVVRLKSPSSVINIASTLSLYAYAFFIIHGLNIVILSCLLYLGYYVIFVKEKWIKLNFRI